MSQSSAKPITTVLAGGEVVDDTTPQLGGSLDVNGQKIVSVSNGNIDIEPNGTGNILLGNLTIDADQTVGAGQDNYVLTYDDASGLMVLEASAGGGGTSDSTVYSNLISTPTINTMTEVVMSQGSPGTYTGGDVTDGGSGTADISAWTGWIRASSTPSSTMYTADVGAVAGLALTDQVTNFIYIEYNAGTPQVIASTTLLADTFSNVILGAIFRDGTTLHITQGHVDTHNFNPVWVSRDVALNGIVRESGIVTSETGNRLLAITVGDAWLGTEKYTIAAIDTSVADTFSSFYDDGAAGWTEVTAQTVIDNGFYDDGSGTLAAIGTGKLGVHWVYRGLDSDTYVVYGTGSYNLIQANDAPLPTSLPPHISAYHGLFVAKIIVGLSDTNLTSVQNPWTTAFSVAGATAHGDLSGLSADDHPQYALLAGATFTDNVTVANAAQNKGFFATNTTESITIALFPGTTQGFVGSTTTHNFSLAADGAVVLTANVDKTTMFEADIIFKEAADHTSTPTAAFGYMWVKNDAPNNLYFTDDAGTDFQLNAPPVVTNTQTGTSYTAVLADGQKMITLDNAAAIAMTIPANASVAYPVGTQLNFMQLGAGAVTIGITTDTLDVASVLTLVLAEKFAVATALKVTSTTWVLFGNLAAA